MPGNPAPAKAIHSRQSTRSKIGSAFPRSALDGATDD
jgi:hypothetical protein